MKDIIKKPIKILGLGVILSLISLILGLIFNSDFRYCAFLLWKNIDSMFIAYPFFSGAIFSWGFAVISTLIVLIFAYINHDKRDQYENILEKSKKGLIAISILVLFYISINLASEALTGTGVPIFSEPYKIGPFTHVSPQDLFLISLVFMIISLIFWVAPRHEQVFTPPISVLIIIFGLLIIIFGLCFLFCHYAEPISETPQDRVIEQIWPFGISAVLGILLAVLVSGEMPKKAKDDNLVDLRTYFSIIPAFFVASLVLVGHELVTYPNIAGHMIVGFLFISGFATLVILIRISLKDIHTCL